MSPRARKPQPTTLHQRIRADIENRILEGAWPPGHRIPFEHELMERYGCSRMTVNKALTELVKRGLIERRRKSGSYVTFPQVQSAVMEIHDVKLEVQSLGLDYSFRLDERKIRKVEGRDMLLSVSGGWDVHAGILEDVLTGRSPRGFWSSHARLEQEYAQRYGV